MFENINILKILSKMDESNEINGNLSPWNSKDVLNNSGSLEMYNNTIDAGTAGII